MARLAVEANASGSWARITNYDQTKWNLGTIINQFPSTDGVFIGPNPLAAARPMEESAGMMVQFPHVITFSPTIDWVFLTERFATTGTTQRVFLYEYNKLTAQYNWKGFITCTLPTGAIALTTRGFRVARYLHTTGSVQVTGSNVTGFSTQFVIDRLATGSRIAFGTSDPASASAWYPISGIKSDTALTCSISIGTASYSSYVIDELRPMWTMTSATPLTGGLFIAKGINYGDFISTGTTIPAATTADFQKACYWIVDAGANTNTGSAGLTLDTYTNFLSHSVYIIDTSVGGLTSKVLRYNVRATGSWAGGKLIATVPDVTVTAPQATTGIISQLNNGRIATTSHGPGSGSKSIYFVTATRFYRADIANITAGNATWQSNSVTEIPPGGVNTYAATNALSGLEYVDAIDRFVVLSTGLTAFRHYVTVYPTNSGDQWTHIFGLDTKQTDQSTADSTTVERYDGNSSGSSCWSENGITHICKHGLSAASVQLYALPFGAHWTYGATTNQRAITPALSTPNCNKFIRAYVNDAEYIGGTGEIGQIPTEPFRLYYRTSGISDNSGAWSLLSRNFDLTAIGAATSIQFMLEFKMIGNGFMLPSQIYGVAVLYDDLSTDSHYQPSVGNSSVTTKTFAWRHATAFGSTVPTLRVRLFDAVAAGVLLDDDSVTSAFGGWGKSTNSGSSWGVYDTTDKANEYTYIRYVPNSLADNIKVRALLTLN